VKVEPGKVTLATFAVSLPRVIGGRVVGADNKPLDDVELTPLAPKDSDAEIRGPDEFMKFQTRAWTIFRPSWQDRFEPGVPPRAGAIALRAGRSQRVGLGENQRGWPRKGRAHPA
jgi:hypothetical protein